MMLRLITALFLVVANVQAALANAAVQKVPLSQLHPTQVAVGMRAVEAKRLEILDKAGTPKRLDKYLAKHPIPVIVGPGRQLYMVDHHHLGLALLKANVTAAYVTVGQDLSRLDIDAFWKKLEADGNVHPFDESGRRIATSDLPRSLGALKNDAYRDLARSVRDAGGYNKTTAPFSEFSWADFFRPRVPLTLIASDYQAAVAQAMTLARSAEASALPGYRKIP